MCVCVCVCVCVWSNFVLSTSVNSGPHHISIFIAGPGIFPTHCYENKHCYFDRDNLEYEAYLERFSVALGIRLYFVSLLKKPKLPIKCCLGY